MTDPRIPVLQQLAHRDPKQALSAEELAQVRADLELVEPKRCTCRTWHHFRGVTGVVHSEPHTPQCGKPAVVQRLSACGYVSYRCAEHEANGHGWPTDYCPGCGGIFPKGEHLVAVLPC